MDDASGILSGPRMSTLANGVRVITEHLPHVQTAALGIWAGTGARNELSHEHGIAHLLEHMAFKGTSRRNAAEIAGEIESVGGDLNAMTSYESTGYVARVLGEHVPLALDILSDIVTDSQFDAQELVREQQVIVQEIGAALDTPDDLVYDLYQAAAYRDQPLGRPILGTPETVSGFTADDLRAYLARTYRGDSVVVTVAGQVDHDAVVEQVSSALSRIQPGDCGSVEQGSFTGGALIADKPLEQVNVVMGLPAPSMIDTDFMATRVAAAALGGGMSSRLFQEVREKRGLCYSVYAFNAGYLDTGNLAITAATSPELFDELMDVLGDEIAGAADRMTETDVNRAKAQLKASLLMGLESTAHRADRMARQLLLRGRTIAPEETAAEIDRVTLDDVQRCLRTVTGGPVALSLVGPVDRLGDLDRWKRQLGVLDSGSSAIQTATSTTGQVDGVSALGR